MKYQDYSAEDFIKDEYFKSWVINPTEESDFFWESWLSNHPGTRPQIELAREILLSVRPKMPNEADLEDEQEVFNSIIRGRKSTHADEANKGYFQQNAFLKIAAILIMALSFSIVLFQWSKSVTEPVSISWVEKSNPKGQFTTVRLPDKSVVKLGPNSELRYPESFDPGQREVWLTGEAFFEVEENPQQPFMVHTGQFFTTVLGTSFNVNARPELDIIDVSLLTGKVIFKDKTGTIAEELAPLEKVSLDKKSGDVSRSALNYNLDLAWKDGILVLENDSLTSLKQKLENWYNVRVHIPAKHTDYQFNGHFKKKSLEYVMESISYLAGVEFQLTGSELYIQPNK